MWLTRSPKKTFVWPPLLNQHMRTVIPTGTLVATVLLKCLCVHICHSSIKRRQSPHGRSRCITLSCNRRNTVHQGCMFLTLVQLLLLSLLISRQCSDVMWTPCCLSFKNRIQWPFRAMNLGRNGLLKRVANWNSLEVCCKNHSSSNR